MMNKAYLNAGRNKESDECLTPRYAVEPLLNQLAYRKNIWCPFDKDDSMYVRVFRNNGFKVVNTHIDNGQDFFKTECPPDTDVIISNPPYSCKDAVLERLYDIEKPFAMLLPVQAVQGIKRVNMYIENGLQLLCFDRRVNFYTKGELDGWKPSNHFASAYFCYQVLEKPLIFDKLNPIQEPYI